MKVVSVLKNGKGFAEPQALLLHNQLTEYDNVCMTDLISRNENLVTTPLLYNYPIWWSKINLFNPDHPLLGDQDIFYLDIDSLVVGDLSIFFNQPTFTALTDFYYEHPDHNNYIPMASGVMWIPASQKEIVWKRWVGNEEKIMNEQHSMPYHGDQGFISRCFIDEGIEVPRWGDLFPHKIISYKKNVAARGMRGFHARRSIGNGKVPNGTRLVCFHGNPRPWEIDCSKIVD